MPKLIKNAQIIEDSWLPVEAEAETLSTGHIASLDQWLALNSKTNTAVQLEPGELPSPLMNHLDDLELVAINFPVLTDGRGFTYARELRDAGYTGELRAVGGFVRDQMHYLMRCGFNAFQLSDDKDLDAALSSLDDFSEHYQAAVDQPQPLFRRR
ncbi:MAG: DUF934 domain-containing protein [Halioglobus sp.]